MNQQTNQMQQQTTTQQQQHRVTRTEQHVTRQVTGHMTVQGGHMTQEQIQQIPGFGPNAQPPVFDKVFSNARFAQGGLDWLQGFMARHQELSLRKPESTSRMRAAGFNKDSVNEFFENYVSVLEKYSFTGDRIFNLDETGVPTVLKSINVVATKGKKQVGQISSAERGENVTFVGIISATGNVLPPAYIVSRVRNPEDYIQGAPESSLIMGNKNSWMTKELFHSVLQHVKTHTLCSPEHPILLLVDNHELHVSVENIKFCKDSGIIVLSFPPHTTHKLQPLDVGVFGPFKSALAKIYDDWLLSNPGKTITIRNLGSFTNTAFIQTFSRKNIIKAFEKPGIWPLNRSAFTDTDFLPSKVTDHTDQPSESSVCQPEIPNTLIKEAVENNNSKRPKLSDIRPFPKTQKQTSSKGRKKESKSKIYTSTPVLNELLEKSKEKERKLSLKQSKTTKKQIFNETTKKTVAVISDSSSSESSHSSFELMDSDDTDDVGEYPFELDEDVEFQPDDFVMVKFSISSNFKKSDCYYIGKVLQKFDDEVEIKFLRRKNKSNTFVFPDVDDVAVVDPKDIVRKLPNPTGKGTTRSSSLFNFNFNFRGWNIL